MSFVDRRRASRILEHAGLDALVVAEPEGFHYVSGVPQGVAGLFRRAGAGFAVLPADPNLPPGIVIGDLFLETARPLVPDARSHPLWMESADIRDLAPDRPIEDRIAESWKAKGRKPGFSRPATFDLGLSLAALRDLLHDRGLASARLGFDLDYVSASNTAVIRHALPDSRIGNGSPALDRLRMIKTPGEIERLTVALELSEAGMAAITAGIAHGQSAVDLHALFREGVEQEARQRGIVAPASWDYISIGPQPWSGDGKVETGAIVKADVGCVVDGYSSDTSRNFVLGEPSLDQSRLHGILERALEAGLGAIKPGVPLKAAHRAASETLHAAGLAGFSRGHFGHSLGHSLFNEQWPFVAADAEIAFEPDMVMAFEVPIYVTGFGAFNLEDQFIVESGGPRIMTRLPRGLRAIGD